MRKKYLNFRKYIKKLKKNQKSFIDFILLIENESEHILLKYCLRTCQ